MNLFKRIKQIYRSFFYRRFSGHVEKHYHLGRRNDNILGRLALELFK